MKKIYEELEAEIIRFEAVDVITASGGNAGHTQTPIIPAIQGTNIF